MNRTHAVIIVAASALLVPTYLARSTPACEIVSSTDPEPNHQPLVATEPTSLVTLQVSPQEDTPEDVSDHNAMVEETLADVEEAPPGSMVEDGWVTWSWVPGVGFVRG